MRTLEQILENVTAGGQFEAHILSDNEFIVAPIGTKKVRLIAALPGITSEEENFRYIARACSNFPALVRALDLMITAPNSSEAMRVARNAMAEALKD